MLLNFDVFNIEGRELAINLSGSQVDELEQIVYDYIVAHVGCDPENVYVELTNRSQVTYRGNRLFNMGTIVITRGAQDAANDIHGMNIYENLIVPHGKLERGDLCDEDYQSNLDALYNNGRIFSAFVIDGIKFWVITEYDRSATTILLPEEY